MIPILLAPLLTKLAESGLNLLGNAVLNKGKQVVEDKLGVSLDAVVETEEGRQQLLQLQTDHEEELLELAIADRKVDLEFYQVDAADRDSARAMNSAIATSADATWLAKNITPILALIVVVGGGAMIGLSTETDIRMAAVGIVTLVLGFYFGTSNANRLKDNTINNLSGVSK